MTAFLLIVLVAVNVAILLEVRALVVLVRDPPEFDEDPDPGGGTVLDFEDAA